MTQTDRPVPGRHNMYHAVHRGLRLGHAQLLPRIGATDFADMAETRALAADLRAFLALAHCHLQGEEAVIHPEIEARDPGATRHAHEGHDDHERAFGELSALLDTLLAADPDARPALGDTLYRRYARFAAEDLLHMEGEENGLLGTMHRLFGDDELRAIELRIIAGIDDAKMAGYLRLIVPALNPAERAGMLSAMQAAMPPAAFQGVLAAVLPVLSPRDAARLQAALARPAAA
jgi:hypothetical protein